MVQLHLSKFYVSQSYGIAQSDGTITDGVEYLKDHSLVLLHCAHCISSSGCPFWLAILPLKHTVHRESLGLILCGEEVCGTSEMKSALPDLTTMSRYGSDVFRDGT